MANLIGYTLSAQFNDTSMFDDDDPIPLCARCGYRLEFGGTNPRYRSRKRKRDIGATYDGQLIVSVAFREFCLSEGVAGAEFRSFETDKDHFHFVVFPQVQFDSARAETYFENLCEGCGKYESVIGSRPCYLRQREPLGPGFFRTDLLFASGNEKHPVTLVGVTTRLALERSGLRGLEFDVATAME